MSVISSLKYKCVFEKLFALHISLPKQKLQKLNVSKSGGKVIYIEREKASRETVVSTGLVYLLTTCALLMDLLVKKKPGHACVCVCVCVFTGVCVGWRRGLRGNR